MTWVVDILRGLRALGGEARLQDLYKWIKRNRKGDLPPNWDAAIRAELQSHCGESKQFRSRNANIFRNTGRGWWAIREIAETNVVKLSHSDFLSLLAQRMSPAEQEEAMASSDFFGFLNQKAERIKAELLKGPGSAIP